MAGFVWRVSRSGYEWQPVEVDDRRRTQALATVGDCGARTYRPLDDDPTLFRQFAALGPDPAAYIGFANRYGHLTAGVTVIDPDGYPVETESGFVQRLRWPNGEPETDVLVTEIKLPPAVEDQALWWSHVVKMAAKIRAWERDRGRRDGIDRTTYARAIIANLRYRVVPCFDGAGVLSDAPTDLLSALWLQFARAVSGNKIHRQCPNCGAWFEVSAPGQSSSRRIRSDKKYCGDACRMAAHYLRGRRKVARRPRRSARK